MKQLQRIGLALMIIGIWALLVWIARVSIGEATATLDEALLLSGGFEIIGGAFLVSGNE